VIAPRAADDAEGAAAIATAILLLTVPALVGLLSAANRTTT
jgi:hypothetical protein